MPTSAIYFINLRGKVLISRNYRSDPSENAEIHQFLSILMQKDDDFVLTPVFKYKELHFCWIKHNDLYLVATTGGHNSNATMIFAFLNRLSQVLSEYFKRLDEESCCDNFVLIYELLDEMIDFGYPQTTDSSVLRRFITQKGCEPQLTSTAKIPQAVTNAISWRADSIKYRKNEVFLDVIESVNLLVSKQGQVLHHEILGTLTISSLCPVVF